MNELERIVDTNDVQNLTNYIQDNLRECLDQFIFEPNDTYTQMSVTHKICEFVNNLYERNSIADFQVVCDPTNNPPGIVHDNQLVCDVYIKPLSIWSQEIIHIHSYIASDHWTTLNIDMAVLEKQEFYTAYDRAMEILNKGKIEC